MARAMFSGQCDWKLVALSVVIAFCASLTTLALAVRSTSSPHYKKNFWILIGALSMGAGLWGVQNLGMLALHSTTVVLNETFRTLQTLCISVCSSLLALGVVFWKPIPKTNMLIATLVAGSCGAAWIYASGEAILLAQQSLPIFGLVAIAFTAAGAACLGAYPVSLLMKDSPIGRVWNNVFGVIVMGLSVSVVQYAGVLTTTVPASAATHATTNVYKSATLIVVVVAATLIAVFGISMLIAEAHRVLVAQSGRAKSEQERWRLVASANQDGLFDFNLVTGEVFYSPRWKEIIGYSADELEDTLETWRQRIHPSDRKEVDACVEEYLRSRQNTLEMEYRLRHKDGTWRWILARSQAVWNKQGQAIRLVGSHCDITDRKRTIEDLSASEARFSAFMQHNPSIAFIKGGDGKFIYTNPTLERVWKLKPGEWIGKTNRDIWPDAVAKRVNESDREVVNANARTELIEEFEMPDGTTHQFLTAKFTFPDSAGGRAFGGVSIDITERMRSEEQLRASESRYRELFENNPLPSWIYRANDQRIMNVNQAAIEHYGWTKAQFLNLTIQSLRLPAEANAPEAELQPKASRHRRSAPIRHRRNKKSDIWVELSSHEFEAGGLFRLVMANDVTERVALEHEFKREHGYLEMLVAERAGELQASEANWRSLVEGLPQIVWTARPDGYCEYISQQLADYTGTPVEQLRGWGWLSFVHRADRERVRARWTMTVANGADYEVEYRIQSKKGEYRWFVTHGRSIKPAGEESVSHWLGTTSDIDDQKRSAQLLESAVQDRTVALAEACSRAEHEARSKSDFLAAMSHEIRTPLSGVIGMANLIADTHLTSEQRSHVETIRSCGDALLNVINDVLDFSKIEAGKMELETVEFNLELMLEECVELVAASADSKGIRVGLHIGDDLPFNVLGDVRRIKQVLLNLLSNAVKFTKCGSITVTVARESAEGGAIRFGVRDTGIGLTAEEQAVLFQPFVQADKSTTRRFGGTGLGLSIAKRLVELMGGDIGVISESGRGSTFWFRIVLAAGSRDMPADFQLLSGTQVLLRSKIEQIAGHLQRTGIQVIESADDAESTTIVIADADSVRDVEFGQVPLLVVGNPADYVHLGVSLNQDVAFISNPVRCLPLLRAIKRLLGTSCHEEPADEARREQELKDARILLVEDNQVNQLISKLFLSKLGCQVTVANNGVEACAALEYRSFDLILMDCQMPDMDGFEATRVIREREVGKRRRTPIVALSAGVLREERERCYAAGMDDFLSKPLEKRELEAALSTWLTERKSATQAAGA